MPAAPLAVQLLTTQTAHVVAGTLAGFFVDEL
jgi:hypothetical protein